MIAKLRRLRMTAAEIAETLAMPLSTVSGILTRLGHGPARPDRARAGRPLRALAAGRARPRRRQEARPDPRRRPPRSAAAAPATTQTHDAPASCATSSAGSSSTSPSTTTAASPTPKSSTTRQPRPQPASSAALSPSTAATASRVERVITDNGAAYRAVVHALACRRLGIRHLRTRPYRPQTNGKAERFIRTLLAGWAYGAIYGSSRERTAALDGWLWHYNHRRRHSALGHQPPVTRTNLLGSYS